jgi:hypothetical protein
MPEALQDLEPFCATQTGACGVPADGVLGLAHSPRVVSLPTELQTQQPSSDQLERELAGRENEKQGDETP